MQKTEKSQQRFANVEIYLFPTLVGMNGKIFIKKKLGDFFGVNNPIPQHRQQTLYKLSYKPFTSPLQK